MKRIYLGLIALVCGTGIMAQQEFYVFIQDPSHQPFYVRMGEESHSSSAEGHIILSRLKDSVYNFYVGFPRTRGEQLFNIVINRKDHGYELRNAGGKWQLFDLVTLQLINPVASTQANDQTMKMSDSYSVLIAGVVDDSAVLYSSPADTLSADTAIVKSKADSVTVVTVAADSVKTKKKAVATAAAVNKKAKKKTQVIAAADSMVIKKDQTVIVADSPVAVNKKADITADATSLPDSSVRDKRDIIRLSTENIDEGRLMIYVDRTGPVNDTIRIIIPRKL